ncbi:21241_t:CDS:2, partial [Dentiscutata erythropus]
PKQIRDWRSKKNKLMNVSPHIKRMNKGKRPKYPELENEVYKWVQELRHKQKPVRNYYNEWMADEVHTFTKKGRIKRPAYNLIAQWVLDAWNNIDPTLI